MRSDFIKLPLVNGPFVNIKVSSIESYYGFEGSEHRLTRITLQSGAVYDVESEEENIRKVIYLNQV